ncbi:FAD:protein FMN transferase [Aestuariispira ectoiniformans]|uniref:FAD:protein FMN transferase n=1 Tax=Aestuariispira ectoiniformans TaxID=2775080 RepID=UPI00223BA81C|nr:FAD:protein FMN transferase [Aestuariispira ectoiniformans]
MQRNSSDISAPFRSVSRRRFIAIAGAVAGTAMLPGGSVAAAPLHRWQGVALGADASIQLAHPDRAAAQRLIDDCVAEVRRLERVFSLYDAGSTLAQLNQNGFVDEPPLELIELLGRAGDISELTGGAFDVTVQPLWARYAEHFAQPDADPAGPNVVDILPLVDWRKVEARPDRVAFAKPGMGMTLNGIAQGFITDRIAVLLKRNGIDQVLVDLGEIRAVGSHPDGRAWQAGINDPERPGKLAGTLDLADRALATSGGYGTVFDQAGRISHLLDPRTGKSAAIERSVSVLAKDATTADALSTAFSLMPDTEINAIAAQLPDIQVYVASGHRLIGKA